MLALGEKRSAATLRTVSAFGGTVLNCFSGSYKNHTLRLIYDNTGGYCSVLRSTPKFRECWSFVSHRRRLCRVGIGKEELFASERACVTGIVFAAVCGNWC